MQRRYHPPKLRCFRGTAVVQAVRPVDSTLRLVEQLNALSQLTESLAFRVVELEERLAATEMKVKPLLEAGAAATTPDSDTELRLEDTEERIARLESLLNGVGSISLGRHWSEPVAEVSMAEASILEEAQPEPVAYDDPDPFVEEGEQPFMDELAA